MNEWADLHGESLSDFDPEPEKNPNGEWVCLRCGSSHWTWRSGEDYQFCVKCGNPMVWKSEDRSPDAIWCRNCETWVERKDLKRWTGDDALHYLCNGCDDDLLPVQNLE